MGVRRRQTPEAARRAILDAAELRLHDEGLEGVRIQRIAADLGITDAAVHYHFGTREALLETLLRRVGRRLVDDIDAMLAAWPPGEIDIAGMARLFRRAFADERAARLALWLSLSGWRSKGNGMFLPLARRVHQARCERAAEAGKPPPPLSDTQYAIALLSAAQMHAAVFGETLLASVADDPARLDQEAFLTLAADLVAAHLAR